MSGSAQWTMPDIARALGLKLSTVHSYRRDGYLPPPDGYTGRVPWWFADTVADWQRKRPGRGWWGHS